MAVRVKDNDYDSGLTTLPGVLTVLTKSIIRGRRLLLCNLTAIEQSVTLSDRSGAKYLNAYPLTGHMTQMVDLGGVQMDGLSWQAGSADAVNAQLIGERP